MSYSRRAITRSLKDITKNPQPFFSVAPVNDDIFHWEASISGPKNSPYEGGVFKMVIYFGPEYPITPPKVLFKTRVFHPNVGDKGVIYLKMLLPQYWSPANNIQQVFASIHEMLSEPKVGQGDWVEEEVANLFKTDKARFDAMARQKTVEFAMP